MAKKSEEVLKSCVILFFTNPEIQPKVKYEGNWSRKDIDVSRRHMLTTLKRHKLEAYKLARQASEHKEE